MRNIKQGLRKIPFLSSTVLIFAILTVIITFLFNFNGIFKITRAKGLSSETLQKQIGYISKVYEKDGQKYLSFKPVKFLTGQEAVNAAKKDGNAVYENGQYYVLDDYYIVDEGKQVKDYAIDNNAALSMLGFMAGYDGNDITNRAIDYDKFKIAVNNTNYPKLCYIYTRDNVVVKVEGQYVP